jgi:hypothetical protein
MITNSAISEIVPLMVAYRVIILFDNSSCRFPLLLRRRGGQSVDWAMLKRQQANRNRQLSPKNK